MIYYNLKYLIFSTLSIEKIENLIYAEINTLEDIILNTIIYAKDLKNCILQTHIDSIICTSSHGEVIIQK